MAYITSGTSTTLELQLTDEGRQALLNNKSLTSLFQKFAISDEDIDYRNTQKHADTNTTTNDSAQLGYLPYVTGNLINFRKQINSGYRQKNIIWATPANNTVITRGNEQTYVAIGVKTTNNTVKYYRDTLELDVYLHDYFVLNKLIASKYIADHKDVLSSTPTTIQQNLTNYFNDTLNVITSSDYESFLNDLSEFGIGQYMDFWDSVKVYDGATFKTDNIKLVPYKDFSYYNSLALTGGAYMNRGENNGINFSGTYLKGLNIASPFSLVFSPGINVVGNRYNSGAGSAGIGFEGFSMGYLNCGGINNWNVATEPYPLFNMENRSNSWSTEIEDIKSIFIGFVTAVDMETGVGINPDGFTNPGYDNISTTIPAARLVLNINTGNDMSPTYYPIKLKRITKEQGKYVNINAHSAKGINITETTHPTDTFGLLVGGLEYSSNWNSREQGFKSSSPYFSMYPSKDSGLSVPAGRVAASTEPYYTLATRMMKMADDIFIGVASQNSNFWLTDTYSGGYRSGLSGTSINHYNVSIPITWNVYSTNSPAAAPCKVTVRFKFNKEAVTDSISYNTLSSQNYYRLYDNAEFKFYGAAGVTKTSFSPDPRGFGSASGASTTWQTSAGEPLFRKVITGQEI
tara:strand:- start:13498 stop:15387 length:1890 start_codon:yes stop_codon:yes gene_type:complete